MTTTLDTRMTGLNLGPNNLVGTVPDSIGKLGQLSELGLFENPGLTGTIPSAIGQLSLVQRAHLYGTGLSGSIPPAMGNLTSLMTLMLNANRLDGSLPASLLKLTKLTKFEVQSNRLSGLVPAFDFARLSEMEQCNMDGDPGRRTNKFACPLPPNSGKCQPGPPQC